MASWASSREKPVDEPVTTMVNPSSVRGTLASRSSAIRTPADRHLSTMARCQSTLNHSVTAAAMVGPTPSTAASCSVAADVIASKLPHSVASARAAGARPARTNQKSPTPPPQRLLLGHVQVDQQPLAVGRKRAAFGGEQLG